MEAAIFVVVIVVSVTFVEVSWLNISSGGHIKGHNFIKAY